MRKTETANLIPHVFQHTVIGLVRITGPVAAVIVSENVAKELEGHEFVEILGPPEDFVFDQRGNFPGF